MDEYDNENEADSSKFKRLKKIAEEIETSWQRDCDRTEYMSKLIDMIKEILTKGSLEEYFSEDEKLLPYFMDEFLEKVL